MKTIILILFLIIFVINHIDGATDYCSLCKNHIACKNTGEFSSTCPKNPSVFQLNQFYIDTFLKAHNELRNKLAGGLIKGFRSAANISVVAWDPELAYLAELNVKQCQIKPDECINTEKYPLAGQNLGIIIIRSSVDYPSVTSVIQNIINSWFDEYKVTNQTQINSCCFAGAMHFSQLIQYRVVAIGCALARYIDGAWKNNLIACNYSFGNLSKSPIYIAGPAASTCKNGRDKIYKNLCK